MKRVELRVRHVAARQAFKPGALEARLEEVEPVGEDYVPTGEVAFTTRGHETWSSAATAALRKADRMAWHVVNRGLVVRKIASEKEPPL